jgi:hypothetical protein
VNLAWHSKVKFETEKDTISVCFAVFKSFKILKLESLQKHIKKVHQKIAKSESTLLVAMLAAVMAFVIKSDTSLTFSIDDYSTKNLQQLANIDPAFLPRTKFRDVIIILGMQDEDLLKEEVSDMHFMIPTLNFTCLDFFKIVLKVTSKCHKFYSLTQDRLTVKKTNFKFTIFTS